MTRRDLRLDPDPLTIPPEPVQRATTPTSRRAGCVSLATLVLVVITTVMIAALVVATPRSAQDVRQPGEVETHPGLIGAPLERGGLTDVEPVAPDQPSTSEGAGQTTGGAPPAAARTQRGWATWCAPTPTKCQGWGGGAMVGAVRSFTFGDDPYVVQVCAFGDGRTACTHVRVVSHCACGDRHGIPTVIDLSPAAFRDLAPLSRGVIRVEVSGAIDIPLPPTDTEDRP